LKRLKKFVIVCTSINKCDDFFQKYYDNAKKFGRLDEVSLVLVCDLKTPKEINDVAKPFRNQGLDIEILNVGEQEEYLNKFPELKKLIPYNSDNRRNIGYLYAVDYGGEVIVSVDDDNFPILEQDFYKGHSICGTEIKATKISSDNKWFNFLEFAKTDNKTRLYPRGFPHIRRHQKPKITQHEDICKISINAGFYVNNPDVDAITRIDNPAKIISYDLKKDYAADNGTFICINSQNTSFAKKVLPCYYFIPQGQVIDGLKIDRFGDIWQGFFAKKCIDAKKEFVAFGAPICYHERNTHSLFKDLSQELKAIECTNYIAKFLEDTEITGDTYIQLYIDLAKKLPQYFSENYKEYQHIMSEISKAMITWADCCKRIL
tara:strand:+ start:727 stop:1851 length:1125 start_codon:yes stop_codon:yes gene_type:complete